MKVTSFVAGKFFGSKYLLNYCALEKTRLVGNRKKKNSSTLTEELIVAQRHKAGATDQWRQRTVTDHFGPILRENLGRHDGSMRVNFLSEHQPSRKSDL